MPESPGRPSTFGPPSADRRAEPTQLIVRGAGRAINSGAPPLRLAAGTARIHPGTGVVVRTPSPAPGVKVAGDAAQGDITLNFADTDVREILRAVLGNLLHLNYAIDSKVQATLTVQTGRPLKRSDVLPALQEALHASGLSLVEAGGIYRVIPSEDATRTGVLPVVVGNEAAAAAGARYNVQVLPLRFAAATAMQHTLEPYLPKGTQLQADSVRNLLILSGTGQDVETVLDMVKTFDVNWLAGMSFAVIPLQTAEPKDIVSQLDQIFGAGGTTPLPGVLRFAPLDKMNAVLVVSPQAQYIAEARDWIERLDRGEDDNKPRIYEYHVQNGRAADIAKVLTALFSSGQVQTVLPQTAPGTTPTQIGASATSALTSSLGLGGGMGSLSSSLPTAPAGLGNSSGLLGAPGMATPSTTASQPTAGSPSQTSSNTASQPAESNAAEAGGGAASGTQNSLAMPPVRIVADEKNNTLLIYARPRDYRMIEDALHKIDVVPLQVLIEATIAEVTLNNDLQFGLQYFFKQNNNQFLFGSTPAAIMPPIPGTFPGFNYVFSSSNTNIVLNALKAVTNVHIVSSPELLVLNHQSASLVVGSEVPVPISQIQSFATTGTPVIGNSIQYVDTGVVLHVSPRVNANGLITLDIAQQVSDVAAPAANTPSGAPTFDQRQIQSTVTVQDGQTIALGGLITDQKNNTVNGIPLLSDIPVLGSLFRSIGHSTNRTELLILLSPKVLHNPIEARDATDELRNRLHSLAPAGGAGL